MEMPASETIGYGSSLRAVPVEITLERAARLGRRLGITRVTEITRLDRVGIPVFASIRPGAQDGSLCVNAGKGVTASEARASAWMEAIEFAFAEPGVSSVPIVDAAARRILDGPTRPEAILDFCPLLGAQIALDEPMPCVAAEELLSGGSCLVPAEMVFLPAALQAPYRYFGSSSNGLASGNTLLEATVHGLAELIERDICAFCHVSAPSSLVSLESLPPPAAALAGAIHAAGLHLAVRALPNPFDLPCFEAAIADPEMHSPFYINGGYGCHPHRAIALARALCEAAQSRLSVIHGGRDELEEQESRFRVMDEAEQETYVERLWRKVSTASQTLAYAATPDRANETPDLASAFDVMAKALAKVGLNRICRIRFTGPEEELCVVRMMVPGLEEFHPVTMPRMGRRLRDYVAQL